MWSVLIWILVVAIGAGSFFYAGIAEKKRNRAMQALAQQLGLQYSERLSDSDQTCFHDFQLSRLGRNCKTSNVIVAETGELRMVLFDYQYITGSGKNSSTHRQSVVQVSSPNFQLPEFALSPEGFFQRIAEFFGSKDIDFQEDVEFSRRYLLRGPNESAIRDFFTPQRRKAFRELENIHLEARGSHVVFYQPRGPAVSESIHRQMEQALQIYKLLSS